MGTTKDRAPRGTGPSGRALWRDVTERFDLDQNELVILREAVRTVDQLDALAAIVDRDGVLEPATGRAHPALVESRQLRLALARLIATLRLPDEADERPQRRGRARGTYQQHTASVQYLRGHGA